MLSEPEVRQVTLPASGGRVIIASDGLWDAVAPKTAAHHVRGMSANKAARELVQVLPLPTLPSVAEHAAWSLMSPFTFA